MPAVQGGAVENLIDFYLDYNDRHKLHEITVYSVYHDAVKGHPALQSDVNRYKYVRTDSLTAKVMKRVHRLFHREQYYHYTIEYFLDRALKDIAGSGYDMIIMENRPGYVLRLREKIVSTMVVHLHNDLLNSTTSRARDIYRSLSAVVCVSDYIAGRVRTIEPGDRKTVTVHNGIDVSAFSRNRADSTTRERIGISKGDFVLIFSGRIIPEKGIGELIESMTRLRQYRDIKLLVLGTSFYGNAGNDNPFAAGLRAKAADVADRIVFTGFVPYSDMPSYLAAADVAVIPSVWDDPFPTSVLEAQAMGLPVITTRRGGIAEEADEANAIFVDTGEGMADRLADAILRLYRDKDRRKLMADESLRRSRLFTKEQYAADFFKAIER